jgi:glycosyltransferase involved in cell wall biosynthesis
MKIAINCADLDYSRIDGTRVYIKQVLKWLGKLSTQAGFSDEFLLYHKGEFNPDLQPPKYSNYGERRIPYRFWWTQTRLPYELRRDRPEVLWMPIQQVPLIAPSSRKLKIVVTIHDLAFKYFPDHFPWKDVWKHNFFTASAVKRADRIIAISEATKQDILKFYPKTKPKKIRVIHHGFDRENFSQLRKGEDIAKTLVKYEIISPEEKEKAFPRYLLYVGAIQPRKNLITLIRAFEQLRKQGPEFQDLKLVLAGEAAWKAETALARIRQSAFQKDIILTGKVSFEELARLYQAAQALIYPSLYEGFGIPILEAMASGIPVVVADNSSLSEVVQNKSKLDTGWAALKFPAKDFRKLAEHLNNILKSAKLRADLIEKGLARAGDFSWEKCARETLELLRKP